MQLCLPRYHCVNYVSTLSIQVVSVYSRISLTMQNLLFCWPQLLFPIPVKNEHKTIELFIHTAGITIC